MEGNVLRDINMLPVLIIQTNLFCQKLKKIVSIHKKYGRVRAFFEISLLNRLLSNV